MDEIRVNKVRIPMLYGHKGWYNLYLYIEVHENVEEGLDIIYLKDEQGTVIDQSYTAHDLWKKIRDLENEVYA